MISRTLGFFVGAAERCLLSRLGGGGLAQGKRSLTREQMQDVMSGYSIDFLDKFFATASASAWRKQTMVITPALASPKAVVGGHLTRISPHDRP